MKLTGDKALAFCKRPKSGSNIVFIRSDDNGVSIDATRELVKAWSHLASEPPEDVRLTDDEVKKDPAILGDAVGARPLFGGFQIVRLAITSDSLGGVLNRFLTAIDEGEITPENYLVITAGELSPKSNTVKAMEASSHVVNLTLVEDDSSSLTNIVTDAMRDSSISLDDNALEVFVDELPGNRALARSEIEKLQLYAHDLGRPVSVEDIMLVSATERKLGADDAADAALAGKTEIAIRATDRFLESGGSPISALRTMHFRLLRVMDALSGERFLKPRVADGERSAFNKMLKSWNAARVTRALTMLYAAEKTCKQGNAPASAIYKTVIDKISRRAI